MKPVTLILSAVVIASVASYATVKLITPANTQHVERHPAISLLERINTTNTIRCGYVAYPPYLIKDPNTGVLSGIFYELTEKMGQLMSLKIDWAYETTFATYIEDMKAGRYDVYCGGLWPEASRARFTEFTMPVNYAAMGLYVRADDARFDNNIELLNNKQYRLATLDGEMAAVVAKEDFPKAQVISHAHTSDLSALITDVVTQKADAVAIERSVAETYIRNNPNSLKNLTEQKPIRIFANTWAVLRGNHDVVSMLDTTLEEMVNTGAVDRIISTYDPGMVNFYPLAKPYDVRR